MKRELRVLHVITRLIVGGAQENTVASVLGLRSKPNLLVQLISGPTIGAEGSLEGQFAALPRTLIVIPELVRPIHPWKDIRAVSRLTRIFRAQPPDIVHTHSGKAGILGRLAAHRAGVPIIVHTIHGPSFGSFQGWLSNLLFKAAERYAATFTTHFTAVANAMSQQYLAAGIGRPEQFTRIWSGFDLQPFLHARNDLALRAKLGVAPDDFVIAKLARLTQLKGHDDLLAAAPELVARHTTIKFLLIGDGPLRHKLERKIAALGLQRHFIFTGLVQPDDVPALLGIADALVHLSRREGLPRAVPQALAAGKPVVAYASDGTPEVSSESVFLIEPGNIEKLAQQLMRLVDDRTLRATVGQAGREWVRARFGLANMVEAIYELYLRLASEAGARQVVPHAVS